MIRFEPTVEAAREADKNGHMREWVTAFLNSEGGNVRLLEEINNHHHIYAGPIDFPLDQLVPILGPSLDFKFPETPEKWQSRLTHMATSLQDGWQPPPLIVADYWAPKFEISDGCHRHAALLRAGIDHYPVIFFFKDVASKRAFEEES